ncbi:TPA: hypothetical protein NJ416_000904 [Vibrio parahaemolyticus]|uniref:hypothetical protein n=1 Tax=Vibrio parahaemolyticus TaxID=670 RepID=UPI0011209898|nr:hypothetical protein [Vibrio parahaemolyticus]TOE72909.1 hypothetical protein CGJ36_20320 [Vibrio parahaemolyticus]TOE73061.1 hypothetical protein CGJ36_19965 [Vibrio parahaemolyticus]TOQ53781.1 hypothetical protein CGG94_07735 [Vibrio parahaemolyticus]HCG7540919.1 hypothetical protein [Vibrio parahaemolyticus]
MARMNYSDHVLFDECVKVLREDTYTQGVIHAKSDTYSYIVTSFCLPEDWEFDDFIISKSEKIEFFGLHAACVSCIKNPGYMNEFDSHLFGQTIAAIMSFSTRKPCKSTRSPQSSHIKLLDESIKKRIALNNPIQICADGAFIIDLPKDKTENFRSDLLELVRQLKSLDKSDYLAVMNSLRLVHMSLLNKRDDFGLAYSLLVASIEAISKVAFSKSEYKESNEKLERWKEITADNVELTELFKEYKAECSNKGYSKKTFKMFIERYAPFSSWDALVEQPLSDIDDNLLKGALSRIEIFTKKPSQCSPDSLSESLDNAYKYRSTLVHSGKQPPHIDPSPMHDLYFIDTLRCNKPSIAPTYDLLLGLATTSIENWLKQKTAS